MPCLRNRIRRNFAIVETYNFVRHHCRKFKEITFTEVTYTYSREKLNGGTSTNLIAVIPKIRLFSVFMHFASNITADTWNHSFHISGRIMSGQPLLRLDQVVYNTQYTLVDTFMPKCIYWFIYLLFIFCRSVYHDHTH